ncbi:MAG: RNA polymerase sigma factor [Bacteroidota bacterium]
MRTPSKRQQQFLQVYQPVHADFERFCRARVYGQTEPEDLLHDALLIAFRKFDPKRSGRAFLSFLCGIAVRILANQRHKATELPGLDGPLHQVPANGRETDARADVHFLHEALARLSSEQRECIILFEINGFNIREIAEIQRASESAVKKRLERGRKRLKALLTTTAPLRKEASHG